MKPEDRRQAVMDILMEAGLATVDELATRFGVSRMTVHRDLDELEQTGLLRKVHGGASIQASPQFESDFRYREKIAAHEKQRLAAYAARMIEPGQIIIIDDSSTAGGLADHIKSIRPLTVVTNNLGVINKLTPLAGLDVIALGGHYNRKFNGFLGLATAETLRGLRADVAFLSSSAILGATAFHQDQEVVQVKRQMMASSTRSYLLADRAKFGRSALYSMAGLEQFEAVITGGKIDAAHEAQLREANVQLRTINEKTKEDTP